MRRTMASFDRDAFVEELLDISAADENTDDRLDGDYDDGRDESSRSTLEVEEEELEWISNKDAFPALETFLDIGQDEPYMTSEPGSPVSVLENSSPTSSADIGSDGYNSHVSWTTIMNSHGSLCVPVRARSKCARKRRRDGFDKIPASQAWEEDLRGNPIKVPRSDPGKAKVSRKCLHCGTEKTPQWRAGPCGPKTLCNACGVRYKSGRLVPEYRPASSPTFSSKLHSNSHRKIMEMRRVKGVDGRLARN